ncbi:hypothetical protein [Mastigocoleus testarum]|uniref:hypothetical protein n=1 Tax=Mastigocoleus testarum TaxID=996925 RepID=UPI00137B6E5B|nr:hypothetical protein [Mastigocoleus testarum]
MSVLLTRVLLGFWVMSTGNHEWGIGSGDMTYSHAALRGIRISFDAYFSQDFSLIFCH